jgi:hypothetical protein
VSCPPKETSWPPRNRITVLSAKLHVQHHLAQVIAGCLATRPGRRDRPHVPFLLKLADGDPSDPPAFVTAVPNWTVGETFSTGRGEEWRILAIETEVSEELVERGFTAVFTVQRA